MDCFRQNMQTIVHFASLENRFDDTASNTRHKAYEHPVFSLMHWSLSKYS